MDKLQQRPAEFTTGVANYGRPAPRRCVVCGTRPARIFDIGRGPWCDDVCRFIGQCEYCGLPPAEPDGAHWCEVRGVEIWRVR